MTKENAIENHRDYINAASTDTRMLGINGENTLKNKTVCRSGVIVPDAAIYHRPNKGAKSLCKSVINRRRTQTLATFEEAVASVVLP
jgi:hypothetical protein